ncbi:MAG: hypothetical protein MZV70_39450 [Desulfobacterales bacterium]|nr:hypothetical protein [Desulfobacterales bacterium]
MIYRPARVTPLGRAVLNTGAFGLYTTVRRRHHRAQPPGPGADLRAGRRRTHHGGGEPPQVRRLVMRGGNIYPVPTDPDLGDGQGNCNLTRTAAAEDLLLWLAADPTGALDADVLIIGDLNASRPGRPGDGAHERRLRQPARPLHRRRGLQLRVRRAMGLSRPRARFGLARAPGERRDGVAHQCRRAERARLQHRLQERRAGGEPVRRRPLPRLRPRPGGGRSSTWTRARRICA